MNPFDQFAGTLQAALPPQQQQQPSDGSVAPTVASAGGQSHPQQPPQFNLMAQPQVEKKPIMNAPGQPGGGMQGGGMYGQPQGMYGQQQPPQQGMYGQPPQPGPGPGPGAMGMMQPSQSMMGGFGMNGSVPPSNGMGGSMAAPPMGQLANSAAPPNAMAGALVPSTTQSNPYALGPPAGAPGPGAANPFGAPAPPAQQPNANPFGAPAPALGAPPQQQQSNALVSSPFGAPPPAAPQANQMVAMDPFGGAPPSQPPAPQLAADPFGAPAPLAQPPAPQLAADPWGGQPPQQSSALVPSAAPPGSDPFGVFGGQPSGGASVAPSVAGTSAVGAPPSVHPSGATVVPPPAATSPPRAPQPAAASVGGDDPWAEMGFGAAPVAAQPAPAPSGPVPGEDDDLFNSGLQPTRDEDKGARGSKVESKPKESKRKKGELPPGGEWYDAKIFTPTLGVMFFKPKELVDSLFLQTDKKLVDSLDERPVVAFIVEGSSARSAGVELGHVLLKVNGIDVRNPKEASRLIKEGPRPLPLLFYVPETSVVVAEGEHMVKYNTKETGAPNSAKDWKPKYVVIGGIIAQPWMMNMYRSKSEYDIAVIETQARRPVSVKVKQFSLQGARIQNDWQGPQMVKYKNKLHPWKYIVVLPISRNPIKIASPNLSQLKPVHEGIRRVLQAQQRDRGGGRHAGPSRGGGGYDTRDQGPRNGGNTSPNAYYGGRERGGGY